MNEGEDEYKTDYSFEQIRKILEENKEKENYDLKFHLSQSNQNNFCSDEPNSKGNLEEETCGP